MAEQNTPNTQEPDVLDNGANTNQHDNKPEGPSIEDLMKEIAQLRAEGAKNKNALDKALKEKGELTKSLREKLTAEEVEAEEKLKAEEAHKEYVRGLEEQIAITDATNRYLKLGMDAEMAADTAKKEREGDLNGVAENCKRMTQQAVENAVEDAKAQWLKDRPQANVGTSGECSVTKAEFQNMGYKRMLAFKKEHPDRYNELKK